MNIWAIFLFSPRKYKGLDMLAGKKLLVQGAGRGNLGLMQTAKRHGVFTIVTGMGGDYPCNPLADKLRYADISDPDVVLSIAREEKIDGIVICCSDTGLQAVGRCNDVLGLSGITEEAACFSSDKLLMKKRLVEYGVRTARFLEIRNSADIRRAVDLLSFPMILKATDLQGSRGITIVNDLQELGIAFEDTMLLTKKDYCIVEEFIIGKEFGAQAFVYQGDVLFVLPHGDETFLGKTAVPIGHFMPLSLSDKLIRDVEYQAKTAIKALGLNNCAVNIDFIEKDGRAYIIELTGRVGANCLPELVSNFWGIDYYEMILRTVLGESPLPVLNDRKNSCCTLSRMVKSTMSGIIDSVILPDKISGELHMFVRPGNEVRAFTNCNDAIGEVIVAGGTLDECNVKAQEIISGIKINMK